MNAEQRQALAQSIFEALLEDPENTPKIRAFIGRMRPVLLEGIASAIEEALPTEPELTPAAELARLTVANFPQLVSEATIQAGRLRALADENGGIVPTGTNDEALLRDYIDKITTDLERITLAALPKEAFPLFGKFYDAILDLKLHLFRFSPPMAWQGIIMRARASAQAPAPAPVEYPEGIPLRDSTPAEIAKMPPPVNRQGLLRFIDKDGKVVDFGRDYYNIAEAAVDQWIYDELKGRGAKRIMLYMDKGDLDFSGEPARVWEIEPPKPISTVSQEASRQAWQASREVLPPLVPTPAEDSQERPLPAPLTEEERRARAKMMSRGEAWGLTEEEREAIPFEEIPESTLLKIRRADLSRVEAILGDSGLEWETEDCDFWDIVHRWPNSQIKAFYEAISLWGEREDLIPGLAYAIREAKHYLRVYIYAPRHQEQVIAMAERIDHLAKFHEIGTGKGSKWWTKERMEGIDFLRCDKCGIKNPQRAKVFIVKSPDDTTMQIGGRCAVHLNLAKKWRDVLEKFKQLRKMLELDENEDFMMGKPGFKHVDVREALAVAQWLIEHGGYKKSQTDEEGGTSTKTEVRHICERVDKDATSEILGEYWEEESVARDSSGRGKMLSERYQRNMKIAEQLTLDARAWLETMPTDEFRNNITVALETGHKKLLGFLVYVPEGIRRWKEKQVRESTTKAEEHPYVPEAIEVKLDRPDQELLEAIPGLTQKDIDKLRQGKGSKAAVKKLERWIPGQWDKVHSYSYEAAGFGPRAGYVTMVVSYLRRRSDGSVVVHRSQIPVAAGFMTENADGVKFYAEWIEFVSVSLEDMHYRGRKYATPEQPKGPPVGPLVKRIWINYVGKGSDGQRLFVGGSGGIVES
jgi:hypothetical protein